MGLLDDINNAFKNAGDVLDQTFDPNKNKVANTFKTVGEVLDQKLDPNKNNVANTFNNGFPEYFHTVGNSMNDVFGKGGLLDNKIGEPSKAFFEKTIPTGTNQFLNDVEHKVGGSMLGTVSSQFLNDVGHKVGGSMWGTTTVSSGTQTKQLDPRPNNGMAITSDSKDVQPATQTNYIIPLVIGGAILAFVMLKK